jgi:tricorn protease
VEIRLTGDLPATRPHWEKVADKIQNAAISPTGARAVFEARGEILTAPAEKGDIRNLTRSTAIAERDPSWSPDGKWIAFFSDQSGEYALHVVDQSGLGEVKKISLGNPPSFFYGPTWSPDSKKIAYTDKRLNVWYVDIDKGQPIKAATDLYDAFAVPISCTWSPDSKWLTFARYLTNHLHAVFVYSLDTAKSTEITDGLSDARYPVFDKGGKYLFFAASTDVGLGASWIDLSGFQRPVSRSVYAVVLKKTDGNPMEPQSDDEKAADKKAGEKKDDAKGKTDDKKKADAKDKEKKDSDKDKDKDKEGDKDKKEEPVTVTIDFENIGQRIVPLPVKGANYVQLDAGKAGTLFLRKFQMCRR